MLLSSTANNRLRTHPLPRRGTDCFQGEEMNPFRFPRAAFSVCICLFSLFVIGTTQTQPPHSISDLSWMTGDWQTPTGGRVQIDEHWTQSAGRSMLGMSRTVA